MSPPGRNPYDELALAASSGWYCARLSPTVTPRSVERDWSLKVVLAKLMMSTIAALKTGLTAKECGKPTLARYATLAPPKSSTP
ncbi:MAG TPA: hypothetical protein VHR39_01890, partial [Propionibacteriaceae bacterium]|nr:hypothetical protein [Propionibacteriaceae bacterium]